MKTYRIPFYLVAVFLVVTIGYIVVQHRTIQRLTKEMVELRSQFGTANQWRDGNAALAGELKVMQERTDAERRELLRLRGQISALRDKEKEIAQLKAEREQMIRMIEKDQRRIAELPSAEETAERAHTISRLSFSKQLGLSLIMAAADNGEQLPPNLEAVEGKYLQKMDDQNIQIGQFEMLYKGKVSEAQDPSRTVLAREKQPTQRSNGTWEQVYVFVDGHAEVLSASSRQELAQREKEQFILLTDK